MGFMYKVFTKNFHIRYSIILDGTDEFKGAFRFTDSLCGFGPFFIKQTIIISDGIAYPFLEITRKRNAIFLAFFHISIVEPEVTYLLNGKARHIKVPRQAELMGVYHDKYSRIHCMQNFFRIFWYFASI